MPNNSVKSARFAATYPPTAIRVAHVEGEFHGVRVVRHGQVVASAVRIRERLRADGGGELLVAAVARLGYRDRTLGYTYANVITGQNVR